MEENKNGKLIIFSAPSGSGKSTLVNYLLEQGMPLSFSVSATNRSPRGKERDGVEYFFLSPDEFKRRIAADDFVEYEEVYPGCFYGTLKEQVEKWRCAGRHILFDVDVAGGCRLKRYYGNKALSLFVQPPSIEVLRQRLTARGTDAPEMIEKRIGKAQTELNYASQFDHIIVNDDLNRAKEETLQLVRDFIYGKEIS